MIGAGSVEMLLRVKNLKKYFPITGGIIPRVISNLKAVDGVDLHIQRGETLGIVGESGCGKTTLGRVILGLIDRTDGEVIFKNVNLTQCSAKEYRQMRRHMQIIFQDPFASLHPRLTVSRLIEEPMKIHGIGTAKERKARVEDLINIVGLSSDHLPKYPHEFSGGQQQRIGIARALALNPDLVICDEPVSALDVSIRSQILNLLADLQEKYDLTYMFISHDLAVVRHVCDTVGVMYLGQLVEVASVDELYASPLHPYTEALFSAIPRTDPTLKRERIVLSGEVPSPVDIPAGCRFQSRCRYRMDVCKEHEPNLIDRGREHYIRCHLHDQTAT
ncbi:MAG: ABC transporter ATP-binding protein [Spirochaetaceae bacterium]|nr:MAG: ABC transporter ATP-binding protein [Spirochaetaceae bacterium]